MPIKRRTSTGRSLAHVAVVVLLGVAMLGSGMGPATASAPTPNPDAWPCTYTNTVDHMTSVTPAPNGQGFWTQVDAINGLPTGTHAYAGAPSVGNIDTYAATIRATPDSRGLYGVSEIGQIYHQGTAVPLRGLTGDDGLPYQNYSRCTRSEVRNNPIVGVVVTPSGKGLVAVDYEGYVWATGDGVRHGEPGLDTLDNDYVTGIAATPTGNGYALITNSGRMYSYGDAPYFNPKQLGVSGTISGIAATTTGKGYFILNTQGHVWGLGDTCQDAAQTFCQIDGLPLLSGDDNTPDLYTDIQAAPSGTGFIAVPENGRAMLVKSAPTAQPDTQAVTAGTPSAWKPTVNVTDGTPYSLTISTPPAHGTATVLPDNTLQYTANIAYQGSDQFQYTATGESNIPSTPATITLNVTAPQSTPVFTQQSPATTAQVGDTFSYQFKATGNPSPTYTLIPYDTGFPADLTFNTQTGVLSGTLTSSAVGQYQYWIIAANQNGSVTSNAQHVTINPSATATPSSTMSPTQSVSTSPSATRPSSTATPPINATTTTTTHATAGPISVGGSTPPPAAAVVQDRLTDQVLASTGDSSLLSLTLLAIGLVITGGSALAWSRRRT